MLCTRNRDTHNTRVHVRSVRTSWNHGQVCPTHTRRGRGRCVSWAREMQSLRVLLLVNMVVSVRAALHLLFLRPVVTPQGAASHSPDRLLVFVSVFVLPGKAQGLFAPPPLNESRPVFSRPGPSSVSLGCDVTLQKCAAAPSAARRKCPHASFGSGLLRLTHSALRALCPPRSPPLCCGPSHWRLPDVDGDFLCLP